MWGRIIVTFFRIYAELLAPFCEYVAKIATKSEGMQKLLDDFTAF